MKYDYIIVGSGVSGLTFAHLASNSGYKCLVIEKLHHLGGMLYSEKQHNIDVHMYGPHIFHTSKKYIWNFVNSISTFIPFINSPLAVAEDGNIYNLPFNMNTFTKLWADIKTPHDAKERISMHVEAYKKSTNINEARNLEEQACMLVGRELYEKFIKSFTEKQWGRSCEQMPPGIITRIPIRYSYNNNYYTDIYQGIPLYGWTDFIDKLITGVDVLYGTDFLSNMSHWQSLGKKIIYTGCIDAYFNYMYGHLPYRSAKWEHVCFDDYNHQGNPVINYISKEIPYTRTIEHKLFNPNDEELYLQSKTIVSYEYPTSWEPGQLPLYPIHTQDSVITHQKYNKLALKEKNTIFLGRMGRYKYIDINTAIHEAFTLFNQLHVPNEKF